MYQFSPVLSYNSNWLFEGSFRHPIFTVVQSKFAVSAVNKFLRVATDGVFGSFRVDDRVWPRKFLLAALRPSVISLIDFMNIKRMVCGHAYNLAAIIVTWKLMKAANWAAASPFPVSQ